MRGDRGDRADATFYVVRVWAAGEGFHAEVRDVRRERGVAFSDALALAAFLAAAPQQAGADPSLPATRLDRKEPR